MTNKALFLALIQNVGDAQLLLIKDKKDFNVIHRLLTAATANAQELANRQNGTLPPPVEKQARVWNIKELL